MYALTVLKILLLNPPGRLRYIRDQFCSHVSKGSYYWQPLDLLILSGQLDAAGFELAVVDAIAEGLSLAESARRIETFAPDAVIFLTGHDSFAAGLQDDATLVDRVIGELEDIGWVHRRGVIGSWLQRVPYAYPIYRLGYGDQVAAVRAALARWPRLSLVGRTGAFRYTNVDGIVEDCFKLVPRLGLGGRDGVQPLAIETGRWI